MNTSARRFLACLAIAGPLVYITVTLAFLFLRPDIDPLHRVMSNYAVGSNGLLMVFAFVAAATGVFATAALILGSYHRAWPAALLLVVAACLIVAAIFPTDVNSSDVAVTTTGAIHIAAGVVTFLALTIAALGLSPVIWPGRAAILSSVLVGMAFVFLIAGAVVDLRGLGQRIFVYTALLWLASAAYRTAWRRAGVERAMGIEPT